MRFYGARGRPCAADKGRGAMSNRGPQLKPRGCFDKLQVLKRLNGAAIWGHTKNKGSLKLYVYFSVGFPGPLPTPPPPAETKTDSSALEPAYPSALARRMAMLQQASKKLPLEKRGGGSNVTGSNQVTQQHCHPSDHTAKELDIDIDILGAQPLRSARTVHRRPPDEVPHANSLRSNQTIPRASPLQVYLIFLARRANVAISTPALDKSSSHQAPPKLTNQTYRTNHIVIARVKKKSGSNRPTSRSRTGRDLCRNPKMCKMHPDPPYPHFPDSNGERALSHPLLCRQPNANLKPSLDKLSCADLEGPLNQPGNQPEIHPTLAQATPLGKYTTFCSRRLPFECQPEIN